MKFIVLLIILLQGLFAYDNAMDFLAYKRHLIIYADGIAKELLDAKLPVIDSRRPQILEIRNLCKLIECNYQYLAGINFPNAFVSNKCYIANDKYCRTSTENNAISKLQETIHESDFSTSIKFGGESYGIIGDCKTEDAVIFEIGDRNILPEDKLQNHSRKHVRK